MFARTLLVAALGVQAALAAPNLAARWGHAGSSDKGTNGTSPNGTFTNTTGNSNDTEILQFALTLEHLEIAFYNAGLSAFNETAFQNAGFAPKVRELYTQILEHETTHAELLTSIIGPNATQACNYTFPFTDPVSFATLSFAIESGGEAAYLGASLVLQNSSYLEVAATIAPVEARQASWVSNAVLNGTPWNGPFDTPLTPSNMISLATSFIVSCPSTNPPLPIVPLPVLTLNPANATVNQSVSVSLTGQTDFNATNVPITNSSFVAPTTNGSVPLFLAFYHGFNISFVPLNPDNTTVIPDYLAGLVFAQLVSSNESVPAANTTLSGLAPVNIGVAPTAVNTFN